MAQQACSSLLAGLLIGLVASGCSPEVTGPNLPPVAVAGPDLTVVLPGSVTLDGSASYDPDGDAIIEYAWELTAAPAAGIPPWSRQSGAQVELVADQAGAWVVRLLVSDGSSWSGPDLVVLSASARPCDTDADCDDGLWCSGDELCQRGVCAREDRDCSEVEDGCNGSFCEEDEDRCEPVPAEDGTQCDDGLWCTEGDACSGGACGGSERDCSEHTDECAEGVCDETQEACVAQPVGAGEPCDDGSICTEHDECDDSGACAGTPLDCSALDGPCRRGVCDETDGICQSEPIGENQPCNDGLFCNIDEVCQGGFCGGGVQNPCDDNDPCTHNLCDEANDLCNNPLNPQPGLEGPWDDATCHDGVDNDCDGLTDQADVVDCVQCSTNADCDDGMFCTQNACVGGNCQTNFLPDGTPCDDGLYCNHPDSCSGGVCWGPERDCGSLGNDCNLGVCNEGQSQCQTQPFNNGGACDDGLYCTENEICSGGLCGGGALPDCSGVSGPCLVGVCDEGTDSCIPQPAPDGESCDDGLYCNENEVCQGGSCTSGNPLDCSAIAGECETGLCNEALSECQTMPAPGQPCDDGDYCNGQDLCGGTGLCSIHPGNPCLSGAPCNQQCNQASGDCYDDYGTLCGSGAITQCDNSDFCDGAGLCLDNNDPDGTPCDDMDACTGTDTCQGGQCVPGAIDKDEDEDTYIDLMCGGSDCDDGNEQINPGVPENCNDGIDNDCDTNTDLGDPDCGWWNTAWHRRRKLVFDNSGQSQHLLDFPVLVVLWDPDRIEYGSTLDQGQDIRFIDDGGSGPLSHEIEQWDEDGSSFVWVKVPRIDASSDTGFIWMYYGHGSAGNGEDPPGTWNDSYRAVWHLNELVSDDGTGGTHSDSTGNGNDGIQYQNGPVSAISSGGQHFDGFEDYVRVGNVGLWIVGDQITIGAWARPTNESNNWPHVIGAGSDGRYWQISWDSESDLWHGALRISGTWTWMDGAPGTYNDWNYVVLRYNGTSIDFFVDGELLDGQGRTGNLDGINSTLRIGDNPNRSPRDFGGDIDEVRISEVARSEAWIRAQFLSMSDGGFVTYGPVEIQ